MAKLYTVKEVAGVLGTNVDYVYRLQKAGLLRFMKLGSLKCREEELQRFLKESEGKDLTDVDNIKKIGVIR